MSEMQGTEAVGVPGGRWQQAVTSQFCLKLTLQQRRLAAASLNSLLAALGKGLLRMEIEAVGLNEGSGLFMDLIYPCDPCPQLTQAIKS